MTQLFGWEDGAPTNQETFAMPLLQHHSLNDCKTVFARNLKGFYVSDGCVVFNAPRPLLGREHTCQDWCHGRFYAEVEVANPYSPALIQKNNDLDARIVISITDSEAVELLLADNKYAHRYRELPFSEQVEMLIPDIQSIQNLPYADAVTRLSAARANLGATLPAGFITSIQCQVFLALAEEAACAHFDGSMAEAAALIGKEVTVYTKPDAGLCLSTSTCLTHGEPAVVTGAEYRLFLDGQGGTINLGTFSDFAEMANSANQLSKRLAA